MNEKIKELAIKAQNNGDSIHYYDPVFVEKFAELIVKECMDVCSDRHHTWRWDNEPDSLSGPGDCAQSIKQHFGVEELQQPIDFETQDPETAKGTKVEHLELKNERI